MIITYDKDRNILIGDLVVKNMEELKKFRDCLMNGSFGDVKVPTYKVISDENKLTLKKLFKTDSFRKDDTLVVRRELNSDSSDEICEYNEKIIASCYLNSILIFTSLLGKIDKASVRPIAQQFIENGIFRYDSFDSIWKKCSKELLEQGNKYDLIAFRAALEEPNPTVCYEISRVITEEESRHGGVFKSFDNRALDQIKFNSEILLGNNFLIKSKVKR